MQISELTELKEEDQKQVGLEGRMLYCISGMFCSFILAAGQIFLVLAVFGNASKHSVILKLSHSSYLFGGNYEWFSVLFVI